MDHQDQVVRQARLFGGSAPWDEVNSALEGLPEPIGLEVMKDLAREANLGQGRLVLDLGAHGGRHAIELASEFRCHAIALDLVSPGLLAAAKNIVAAGVQGLVSGIQADAHTLPLRASTVDLIWARDMLSCVDPRLLLSECARVLKPGGLLILHAVYMTELMEQRERERFVAALALTDGCDRQSVEEVISIAGFRVQRLIELGAQSRERELASGDQRLSEDLLALMRLRRGSAELIRRFGAEWYETILAWRQWAVFMALGKLDVAVYLLRLEGVSDLGTDR